jgi:hypothetical protein
MEIAEAIIARKAIAHHPALGASRHLHRDLTTQCDVSLVVNLRTI